MRKIKAVILTGEILSLFKDSNHDEEMKKQEKVFKSPWFRKKYKDYIIWSTKSK